jgi:hypothetical protein
MIACASKTGCDFVKNPQLREIYTASLIDRANRLAAVNRVVSQIHHQVDAFIASAINPTAVSKLGIEKDLKDILDIRFPDESTPTVFISETANQRILVIAYEIDKGFMGVGGTSVTIRAYRASPGKFTLADSTGNNLDGYANISVKELRPPAESLLKGVGDVWLLAWGT